jgi:DNA-binding MarR family transcriptional regulator
MKRRSQRFVRPNRWLRELKLLEAIDADPESSQRALGRETELTAAMVNQYILELAAANHVEVEGETNRSLRYRLTEAGRRRREQLRREYLEDLSMLHTVVRDEYRRFLRELVSEDLRRAAVVGANDKSELVCDVAPSAGMEIVGVFDEPGRVDPDSTDIVLDCRFEGIKPIPRAPSRPSGLAA